MKGYNQAQYAYDNMVPEEHCEECGYYISNCKCDNDCDVDEPEPREDKDFEPVFY